MTISEQSKYLFIQIFEYQNGVNLYGYMPLKSASKPYKKALRTTLLYCQNRGYIQMHQYIKENF